MIEDIDLLTEQAGRLIAFALRPRLVPGDQPEYADLVRLYESDARFQSAIQGFLRGMGLRVLGISVLYGLVVGSEAESVFAVRRDDYRASLSATERMMQGLVHLGIAAWCFPRAEDLAEPEDVLPARLNVESLVEYLSQLCEEMKRQDAGDAPPANEELRTAWQGLLALGKFSDSADGKNSFATLAGKVRHALNFMTEQGLLKREDREGKVGWLARPAFRLHVRELAGHAALQLVNQATQRLPHHGPAA